MWNKMEVFYHVVKAGSFTRAEKIMNKSQATLTYSIKILEERLDTVLFRRSVKGLILTRKGEEVFQSAQRMIMEMEGLRAVLDDKKGVEGKVRINTTYAIANYVIGDYLLEFNELYPDIIFEIICSDTLIDIIQNEVDIAITTERQKSSWVVEELLYETWPALYASPDYIEKFGIPKNVRDLDQHRLLAYPRPIDNPYLDIQWHLKIGKPEGEKRQPVYTANSVENLFNAAERGVGIISSHAKMKILEDSSLVNINPDIRGGKYDIYISYLKRFQKNEKIQTLVSYLMEKLSSQRREHS